MFLAGDPLPVAGLTCHDAACPCPRSDRIEMHFAAVHESADGPLRI